MERLRQAVWHGLEEKLGADKTSLQYNMASSLSGGRIFAAPTAYLRPNISSHGRGIKACLLSMDLLIVPCVDCLNLLGITCARDAYEDIFMCSCCIHCI